MEKGKTRKQRPAPDNRRGISITGYGPVPDSLNKAFVLAVSIAATIEGAHHRCQRRECRNEQRCCSAAGASRDLFCDAPLSRRTDDMVLGMFLFMMKLANGET